MGKRAVMTFEAMAAQKPQAHPSPEPTPAVPARKVDERKGQTLRLSVEAWRQLKFIAFAEATPVHDILVDAVNDAFRKRGKPPIA